MALKSEVFTLCSDSFEWEGSSAFGIHVFIYALVFPYIFLLVDCFEWALIDGIEKQSVHSLLWQFQMGWVHLTLVFECALVYI